MPRFAILRHDSPRSLHWDFFLEAGETLLTWELPAPPGLGESMICRRLVDHRLEYLEYQGPISGDRGYVTRWDGGLFEWLREQPDALAVRLCGDWLAGTLTLSRLPGNGEQWRLSFGG